MATQEQNPDEINPLMPGRFQEKAQLQELNHRLSNYMQLMRMKRESQTNKGTGETDDRKWASQMENQRLFYEQQLFELREQLQQALKEKNEAEAAQMKYQSMSSEYEERFLSLNDTILKQTEEITKLQMALSGKELELQQAKNQLTGPRTELDMCKLERDDLKKRLAEVERRCQSETKAKTELQQQLTEFHARCSHEILIYQKELDNLHERLERSQQVVLELEESSRRNGQRDNDIAEMMRKTREASEVELRRFMEEAEAKHNLDISEIKMRMQADRAALANLTEENAKLQAELNNVSATLQMAESQLASVESAYKVAQTSLISERKSFEIQMKKMERKLQETQDLLLIKIQELTSALDANVPLKAEIDMLRNLVEEEEKRIGLDTSFERAVKSITRDDSHRGMDEAVTQSQKSVQVDANTRNGKAKTNRTHAGDSQSMTYGTETRLDGSLFTKPHNSLPLTTKAFARGAPGANAIDLFTPPSPSAKVPSGWLEKQDDEFADEDVANDDDDDDVDATVGELIARRREANSLDRKGSTGSGMAFLPPRPDNPTPPRKLPSRPASAASRSRYVPADAGQGRDYFDAMFNDLRKDTMYTRVSESNVGTDTTRVVPSTQHDLVNSTSSATGSLKIIDVDESGKFVRVHNTSSAMVEDIGGHLLQQNVAGHPVAVFRFPPRTKLQPGHTATVWGAGSKEGIHDPPSQYIWKQLDKWGTGPECTTILCKANGQAIAWMTSAPRVSRISRAYQYQTDEKSQAAEIARLMKELHAQQTAYNNQTGSETNHWDGSQATNTKLQMPYPSAYSEIPTVYSDSSPITDPSPILKREKMLPTSSRLLPTRTGSAPLRKYVVPPSPQHHSSKPLAFQQRLATNGDAELIDLTTQRSARSKYGFDFMTHTPKVTSYDGTVRER